MIVSNITDAQLQSALITTNDRHGYQLRFKDGIRKLNAKGTRLQFTIRSVKSGIRGASISRSGRNSPVASWHAHGHLFDEILNAYPQAVIRTAHHTYDADHRAWVDIVMMSIEYINQLSREAGSSVANREDRQPRVFFNSADRKKNFGRIPNLGHYRASRHGWKLIEHKLVDKSGFGAEDEPALTVRGLNAWMAPYDDVTGVGWAIIKEGQFQVVIGRFENAKLIKEQGALKRNASRRSHRPGLLT